MGQYPFTFWVWLQNMPLQLAPSVGKAYVILSATVNYGRIKFLSARVHGVPTTG